MGHERQGKDDGKAAFDFLMSSGQDEARVLVTPMIATGIEIVIGGARDRQFGPVVMLGLGGVGVEVLKDVTFRPTPISSCEAVEMFGELRSRGLFFTEDGNTTPGVDARAYRRRMAADPVSIYCCQV